MNVKSYTLGLVAFLYFSIIFHYFPSLRPNIWFGLPTQAACSMEVFIELSTMVLGLFFGVAAAHLGPRRGSEMFNIFVSGMYFSAFVYLELYFLVSWPVTELCKFLQISANLKTIGCPVSFFIFDLFPGH